jgi:hypothetical protein
MGLRAGFDTLQMRKSLVPSRNLTMIPDVKPVTQLLYNLELFSAEQ